MNTEAEITAAKINTLLKKRRLTSWNAGFLTGLRGHAPTRLQLEILDRLVVQQNLTPDEYEHESPRTTDSAPQERGV